MNIVKLVQGSPEWHEHRAKYRNASETAAVMGVSPWMTPLQLWELRTNRRQSVVTAPMARGTQLEPRARACYEQLTGHVMQPLVLRDGEYSASLDGLSFDRELLLEIKCPARGSGSTLWKEVSSGRIPEHYAWQVEHQLMVAKARLAHLYVFDEESSSGVLLEAAPQPERWELIHEAWEAFMGCIASDCPPPLADRDKVVRSDAGWSEAAREYLARKAEAEQAAGRLEKAKDALVALAAHTSESGSGVTVTRFWKQGPVDYKKVPQLQGLDLSAYRGAMRQEVRVSTAKS